MGYPHYYYSQVYGFIEIKEIVIKIETHENWDIVMGHCNETASNSHRRTTPYKVVFRTSSESCLL